MPTLRNFSVSVFRKIAYLFIKPEVVLVVEIEEQVYQGI